MKRLLRALLRDPKTSLPALLLLAIGVGGFGWMLALRHSLLLRSLPVKDPDRLVAIYNDTLGVPDAHGTPSRGELMLFREKTEVFEGVAAVDPGEVNLGGETPRFVRMDRMTVNGFQVLGVQPALGRDFTSAEEDEGQDRVVLITHAFWRAQFGQDPAALGRTLELDGVPHQVIGVLPAGFHTPRGTELFRPLSFTPQSRRNFGAHFLRCFARLRPGVTLAQLPPHLRDLKARLVQAVPERSSPENDRYIYSASPLLEETLGSGLKILRALMAASVMLLLLAALNASALLLARATSRRRELALRAALGATPWELRRLLLAEGAALGVAGALLGLGLAHLALGPASHLLSLGLKDLPLEGLSLDASAMAFTLLLGPFVGMACALAAQPAAQLASVLKEGGRGQFGGPRRLRQALVLGQLALAGGLLGTAAWIQVGLHRLHAVDPGFQPQHAWAFRLSPPQRWSFRELSRAQTEVQAQLAQLPGVTAVGALNSLPMTGFKSDYNIQALGSSDVQDPQARSASPGALKAMGFRLLRGRDFTEQDSFDAPRVALLTRNLARACFGDENPVGRQVDIDGPVTVIGELADIREFGPGQPATPTFYLPYAQGRMLWNRTLHLVLRHQGPAPSLQAVARLVASVAPGLGVHHAGPVEGFQEEILGPQRMTRALLTAFALLSLLLAAGGVYGLMSATVQERTGEFGVRSALGAQARDLLALVLGEALRLSLLGALAGYALGLVLTYGGQAFWVDLPAAGPLPGAAGLILLMLTALLACLFPALRAARVDPAVALRAE